MPIDLVIFDLGRVLIRTCDNWRQAFQCAGVELPADMLAEDSETLTKVQAVIERYDTGRIDVDGFCREIAPLRAGGKLTPRQVRLAHDAFLRGPFPGVEALLDDLAAAGVKTACLTNSSDGHWRRINNPADPNYLPIDRFTFCFASHLIGLMKPHDPIYEHVERETGLPPASLLFFDDLQANIATAQRRGWNAHLIRTDSDPIAQVREHLRSLGVLR